MARNLDLALIRAFVAVAETGGMTRAGKLLNLTQAAVSQQVKRLEEFFGQALFAREHRRIHLTPRGERLLPYAQQLLSLNEEICGLMTFPDFEGEVRLGVPHDIVQTFMPAVLKSFNRAWPRVRVAVICGTTPCLRASLERGDLDLTLTTELECDQGGEVLMRDELVWVGARHGCADQSEPLPVALGDGTCAFRRFATKALAQTGRDWRIACEDGNMAALYAALEADLSVAPMLASTIPSYLDLVRPDSGLPALPPFYVNLYAPPAGASAIAVELAGHIRDQFGSRFEQVA